MKVHEETHGKKMILTMAPETHYVQGALSQWTKNYPGAYLPLIAALEDEIDMLNVQLYNSGSMYGLDGKVYNQGSVDFVLSQTEAVILGFNAYHGVGK